MLMNRPLAKGTSIDAGPIVWPFLPQGVKNGVSGQVGRRMFVGLGSAGRSMFALDLDAPSAGWTEVARFPGPARDGAACAVVGGRFFVISGLGKAAPDDAAPHVLQDVFSYDPAKDIWTRLDTRPPAGFLGASAFALDHDRIGLVGGVNTEIFDGFMVAAAASDTSSDPEGWQSVLEAFMSMPPEDHKWNAKLWVYSISANAWSDLGDNRFLPNTGAACVAVPDGVLLINGEIKPGLRTPQVKHIGFRTGGVIWTEQDPIPPLDGRPLQDGLAGAYAGHAGGVLLVAGGANFHGSRAIAATGDWYAHRGLQKAWNREIYARRDGRWSVAGQLPFGLAYGASFELPEGLLLVGGEDQGQIARKGVLLLTWDDLSGQVTCTPPASGEANLNAPGNAP
jgi:N-acetylneuraminate epimerase